MIVVHRILCPLRRLGSARVLVVENLTRLTHRRDVHCQSPQIYTKRFWKTTTSGCMAKLQVHTNFSRPSKVRHSQSPDKIAPASDTCTGFN
ncbi:uncharacterized protein BO87DRAFT_369267 [Aspergillus neoniger CBS 115656]|uniref:Uncharacterized protein n=1 Tax=Aspergillus neoniger (strain CBS 115656) TaxID=1448310 RepID=A0A318YVY5_ASPNB|nr:hypothetical protein BO87DRAFT_369267 [Aspergillus neoniger CBS 115656]PYH29362.1 hypothetical protein BO87DRAFT_369267 [Aspergillus neoniger CBS 115656]